MSRFPTDDPWADFQDVSAQFQQPTRPQPPMPAQQPAVDPWADFQQVSDPMTAPAQAPVRPPVSTIGSTEITQDNYQEFFRQELAGLEAQARERGEAGVSNGAQLALLDEWRQRAGLPALSGPDPDARLKATNASVRGGITGPIVGFGAALPRALVRGGSAIAPETFGGIGRRMDEYYGTPQNIVEEIADVGGTVVPIIATGGAAAPAVMAGVFGAAGAGETREDIARRREAGEEISGAQEAASATLIGGIEAASGFVGGKLFGSIGRKLAASPGIRQIIAKEGAPGVLNLLKSIAPEIVAEAGEEAATQFATNVVRKVGYAPKQELFEGVVKAGAMGGALAPILGGASRIRTGGKVDQKAPPLTESMKQRVARLEGELAAERKSARTDELTGIGNRLQEKEDIELIYRLADEGKESIGVVETDLANFKVVNDELGHDVGDQLLKAEAEAIREALRISDRRTKEGDGSAIDKRDPAAKDRPLDYAGSVNRVGGDEFPIKLRNIDTPEKADIVMQRANEIFRTKVESLIGNKLPKEAYPFIAWGTEIRKPGDTRTAAELTKAAEQQVIPRKNKLKAERGIPETREGLAEHIKKHTDQRTQQIKAAKEKIVALPAEARAELRTQAASKPEAAFVIDALEELEGQRFKEASGSKIDVEKQGAGSDFARYKTAVTERKYRPDSFVHTTTLDLPRLEAIAREGIQAGSAEDASGFDTGVFAEKATKEGKIVRYWARDGVPVTIELPESVSGGLGRGGDYEVNTPGKSYVTAEDVSKARVFVGDDPNAYTIDEAIQRLRQNKSAPTTTESPAAQPKASPEELPPARVRAVTDERPSIRNQATERMRDLWKDATGLFRDPTTGPIGDLEKKIIQSKGRIALASMDADSVGVEFTKQAKAQGLDPESDDLHQTLEAVLRGKAVSPALRQWAVTARSSLDSASADLAEKLESVGLKKQAEVVRKNLGAYLKNVPIESVSPTGRLKDWARRKLALSPSFGKVKRDAYILWDNNRPLGKFESEAEVKAAQESESRVRKERMIKEGAKARGVTEADLNRRATKGLRWTPPISDEWRATHEIHDPRYLVARSIVETRHNAEMIDLFQYAAQTYGQNPPAEFKAEEVEAWAEDAGLVKMPESGRLHALDDTYVPKEVAERLKEHARLPGEVERLYRSALSAWKASKTVYNPGTHVRNWLTNAIVFADLADTSPLNPQNAGSYRKAVGSIANFKTDPVFRRAVEQGLIGNEYSSTELRAIQDSFRTTDNPADALFKMAGKVHKGAMKSYDTGDILFKLAIVHNNMRKGMDVDAAIADADQWMPNYARTAKITRWLRNTPVGSPFVSFFDQSARIAGRAIQKKPLKVAKIAAIPVMLGAISRAILGVREEEDKLMAGDKATSQWVNRVTDPIVPVRDRDGRLMTMDFKSILPLANDLIPHQRNGSIIVPWIFSGPLSNTVVEQLSGKERFTGRTFISDTMSPGENLAARGRRLFDTLAPVPTVATYGRERIAAAATGQSEESTARAILGAVGGINIRTPYIAERVVRKIIQNQIGEKDRDEARALMNEWNNVYKPGNEKNLTMADLVRGARASAKRGKHDVRDEAAEAILKGDTDEAKRLISEYNADKPGRITPLTIEDAKRQSEVFKRQGKDR